jgi:hypothetical protein
MFSTKFTESSHISFVQLQSNYDFTWSQYYFPFINDLETLLDGIIKYENALQLRANECENMYIHSTYHSESSSSCCTYINENLQQK